MCLLFLQKNNKSVFTREEFVEAWKTNRDGFGLYVSDELGNVVIQKTKDLEEAWAIYCDAINSPYKILIGHFRWGTHGPKTEHLIHPFKLNENSYLFHNGIVSGLSPREGESDTSELALFYKEANTPDSTIFSTAFVQILNLIGGSYNKFVVANGSDFYIVNEKAGHWRGDSWYSNSGYVPYKWIEKIFPDDKKKETETGEISLKRTKVRSPEDMVDEYYERLEENFKEL